MNPQDKRLQESMTSLGNEYMGMRGMFEEVYSGDTHQVFILVVSGSPTKHVLVGGRMAIHTTSVRQLML